MVSPRRNLPRGIHFVGTPAYHPGGVAAGLWALRDSAAGRAEDAGRREESSC